MMLLRLRQGNPRLVFRLFSLMLGKPRIRLNNLKTSPEISLSRPQLHHRFYYSWDIGVRDIAS